MSDDEVLSYVRATAPMLGLPLDDAQARRVAVHLGRTAALALLLDEAALGEADEPAELYRPAPFPEVAP